jgi:hypothetical protein
MFQGLTKIGKDLLTKIWEVTISRQQNIDVTVLQHCLEVCNMGKFVSLTAVAFRVYQGLIGVSGK